MRIAVQRDVALRVPCDGLKCLRVQIDGGHGDEGVTEHVSSRAVQVDMLGQIPEYPLISALCDTEPAKYILYQVAGDKEYERTLLDLRRQDDGERKQKTEIMSQANNPESKTNQILNMMMLCDS